MSIGRSLRVSTQVQNEVLELGLIEEDDEDDDEVDENGNPVVRYLWVNVTEYQRCFGKTLLIGAITLVSTAEKEARAGGADGHEQGPEKVQEGEKTRWVPFAFCFPQSP